MSFTTLFFVIALAAVPMSTVTRAEVSVERGLQVSIIGGCHDCHTESYRESDGEIDPEKALKGIPVGWQGPWGTTYSLNLRITVAELHEDGFVRSMQTLRTLPPMPWYNVRAMPEDDLRSLYRYIKSLGDPGEQAPTAVPPGEKPRTPFVVLAPPQMPEPCSSDFDCGVGEVCSTDPVRQCVPR